ncbi:carbamoyltransferase HypF [Candidatus Bathyarchaeota archaeon RBG_13_46_16b]|nr:MAG: carbamoyltransferase HypF [Candidatus Bathyarchaeota archaeon RBG_13_46_16b]
MKIEVTGIVQGVGFRPFVYRTAVKNRLNGYVKNKGDAGVEIILEGREHAIETFLKDLKTEAPPLAQIYDITKRKLKGKDEYQGFTISKSSSEAEHAGSIIPPDIAICDDCLRELGDPKDPRYNYFFITCTNCGPRYTIIERLPYDRENTTMRDFPLCGFCQKEYKDPLNRRFHAQTVACPKCGPKAYLTTNQGKPVQHKDPIREAGKLLSEGNILAIKGYGGFHIAASTTDETPLARLRQAKRRSQKPFAVMARNLETIMTFAKVSKEEEQLLKSFARPIILLDKSKSYCLSDLIAPGLHNIGVMLPYTGLHYMLFDAVDDAAFVMTSANPPNQPIMKDNEEALKTLGNAVDYFLFHDRQIAHRCDDSVLRMHGKRQVFIRRSRGYAPTPIILREKTRRCIVGLGGELNDTSCILLENKAFVSPHIGDVENIETESFLRNTIEHLARLTNSKIEAVACDLQPKFTTTKLAHQLAEENNWQLVQVQHHHAHIAALMAEHNIKEMMGICCDGYGYGTDGEAWGGEILLCTEETEGFKRLAHLEKQPLAGGDLATRYPLRVAAGILSKRMKIEDWLLENAQRFPYGKKETLILVDQLRKGFGVSETTSCGRVLDAIAAILGICYERTYEGEPAMKLESAAIDGKDVLSLEPTIENGILETTQMVYEVFANREKYSKTDLAYSAHAYLARGLATLAIENVVKNDVKTIGFSGGAACNGILASIMRKTVKNAGLQFVVHSAVPSGDGGVSFGQAVVGGFLRH